MARRIIQPVALLGLSHVLRSAYPKMTPQVAVANAEQIIEALHKMDLDIGPADGFGPQPVSAQPLDALDVAAERIVADMGRKPWFPDGVQ